MSERAVNQRIMHMNRCSEAWRTGFCTVAGILTITALLIASSRSSEWRPIAMPLELVLRWFETKPAQFSPAPAPSANQHS